MMEYVQAVVLNFNKLGLEQNDWYLQICFQIQFIRKKNRCIFTKISPTPVHEFINDIK